MCTNTHEVAHTDYPVVKRGKQGNMIGGSVTDPYGMGKNGWESSLKAVVVPV